MRKFLLLLCFILTMFANMMAGEHRTVIISLDGCRWDYPLMYDTPNLDEIGKVGVSGIMQPSFPSLTFLGRRTYLDHCQEAGQEGRSGLDIALDLRASRPARPSRPWTV